MFRPPEYNPLRFAVLGPSVFTGGLFGEGRVSEPQIVDSDGGTRKTFLGSWRLASVCALLTQAV